MSVCGPESHIHTGLRPPLEPIITLAIKVETGFLFIPEKEVEREREEERDRRAEDRWGKGGGGGAGIFHLHSPADMAFQRNLSLDLQNSQLSLPIAVNLAVILH